MGKTVKIESWVLKTMFFPFHFTNNVAPKSGVFLRYSMDNDTLIRNFLTKKLRYSMDNDTLIRNFLTKKTLQFFLTISRK